MANKNTSEEMGDLRCSDLDVPIFNPRFFEPVVSLFLCDITNKQWMLLAEGNIDTETVRILYTLCKKIINITNNLVIEAVTPQVHDWANGYFSPESLRNRNYCHVTQDDIQACLGHSLHHSFDAALSDEQECTPDCEQLLELFSAEIKSKVNGLLAQITGSTSTEPETSSHDSILDMVYLVAHKLKRHVLSRPELIHSGSPDSGSLDDSYTDEEAGDEPASTSEKPSSAQLGPPDDHGCGPDEVKKIQDFNEEDVTTEPASFISEGQTSAQLKPPDDHGCGPNEVMEIQDFDEEDVTTEPASFISKGQTSAQLEPPDDHGCGPDEMMEIQDLNEEDAVAEPGRLTSGGQIADLPDGQESERCVSPVEDLPQSADNFLIMFFIKLVGHIAEATDSSVEVNLIETLIRLREKTGGELTHNLPQSVGKIHIPVYKNLCQRFGSAELLKAAMESGDGAFEEAVVKALKSQLQNCAGERCSFLKRVRNVLCRKSRRVSPVCEVSNIKVSHREVFDRDTLSKRPAIIRMFSSLARILRKPFTCCTSYRSWDD